MIFLLLALNVWQKVQFTSTILLFRAALSTPVIMSQWKSFSYIDRKLHFLRRTSDKFENGSVELLILKDKSEAFQ